jgi:hypothetical protein
VSSIAPPELIDPIQGTFKLIVADAACRLFANYKNNQSIRVWRRVFAKGSAEHDYAGLCMLNILQVLRRLLIAQQSVWLLSLQEFSLSTRVGRAISQILPASWWAPIILPRPEARFKSIALDWGL